jgi:signal transduction histidine kinase
MAYRSIIILILFTFSLQLTGNQSDSTKIHALIKTGKRVQETNKNLAVQYFIMAIAESDTTHYIDDSIARTLNAISRHLYYRGDTEEAIRYALKAMNYFRQRNNLHETVVNMILVGDILRGNVLYQQSFSYLNDAVQLARELHDSSLLASAYNRIAASYQENQSESQDTAAAYAERSYKIALLTGDSMLIYNNLNILGVIETTKGNYKKAIEYFGKAYPIMLNSFPEDEPLLLLNLARSYNYLSAFKKSEELNLQALALAQKLDIPQYIRLSCLNLDDIYTRNNDYKRAHKYQKLYYQSKEYITNQKVLIQLEEFNNRLAIEKQRSENQRLLYEQQISKSRLEIYLILGILLTIILAISTGFLVFQYRQRKKISGIAGKLDQSNKTLTRFISILGHDLRSPFNAILGFTDILQDDPELTEHDRVTVTDKLHAVSRKTFRLLERILEWSRVRMGSISPVMVNCDLTELVGETMQILEPAAMLKKISIRLSASGPVFIQADPDMMLTAIRNILSNAIKFTRPEGHVAIEISSDGQNARIVFRDNGIGIPPERIESIFRLDENYKSQGTAGEEGSGLGLVLSLEYVTLHRGKLEVVSTPGEGSVFTMTLPLPAPNKTAL